jgi:hypothetical protein
MVTENSVSYDGSVLLLVSLIARCWKRECIQGETSVEYMVFDVPEWALGNQKKLIRSCSTIQLPLLLNHDTTLTHLLCVLLIHSVKLTIRTSVYLIFFSFITFKIYLGGAYGLADSMELNCAFIWIPPSVYLGLYGFDDNFYMFLRIMW